MQNITEIKKIKINRAKAPRVTPIMITTLLVVVTGGILVVTVVGRVLLPINKYRQNYISQ